MKKRLFSSIALGFTLAATTLHANEATAPSAYDKIWGATKFVDNDDATVLQSLALTGRLQGDAYSFRSEDSSFEDVVWRRFRLGFKAKLFHDFTLHTEMDLNMNKADQNSWDAFYKRLTDSYVAWSPSKKIKLKVGKQSAGFTLDGATSSKKLLVPERGLVARNMWFGTEYFTGISASGNLGKGFYNVGGFSASGEAEFGHFESGYFALLSAGYKVGEKGSIRLDYVYNDPDYTGTLKDSDYKVGTRNLEHVLALSYKQMLTKKLGIWTEVSGATGISNHSNPKKTINQSDLAGFDIMPFYNITDHFQLVAQYAIVSSLDSKADVKLARYAFKNSGKTGVETAQNLLLGFNWYLYGHKLKWQNAIEYNYGSHLAGTGENYNGYGVTSALRLSW
jgi:phosphate-selective porin OprO/OprP